MRRSRKFIVTPAKPGVSTGLLSTVAGVGLISPGKYDKQNLEKEAEPNLSALSRAELGKAAVCWVTSAAVSPFSLCKGTKKTDCDCKPDLVCLPLWHCILAVRCCQKDRNH